jgi:WD40 repeat protein
MQGHTNKVFSVCFSPDESRIVSASLDATLRVWDAHTGVCARVLEGHSDVVWSVFFSPDGRRILSGSRDKTVRVWDAVSWRELPALSGHAARLGRVAFSPDGRFIASCADDNTVRVWNTDTAICFRTLQVDLAVWLSFSADGRRIATGSLYHTIRFWDIATGACVYESHGDSLGGDIRGLWYTPDGKHIISRRLYDGIMWDAGTGEKLAIMSAGAADATRSDRVALILTDTKADGTGFIGADGSPICWFPVTQWRNWRPDSSPDGRIWAGGEEEGKHLHMLHLQGVDDA